MHPSEHRVSSPGFEWNAPNGKPLQSDRSPCSADVAKHTDQGPTALARLGQSRRPGPAESAPCCDPRVLSLPHQASQTHICPYAGTRLPSINFVVDTSMRPVCHRNVTNLRYFRFAGVEKLR